MKINEPTSKRSGLIRISLEIAYDGTNFSGFGIQPHERTVQGELNKALKKFLRIEKVKTVGAGRTDSGVHARGQVVHFDVPENVWTSIKDPMYKFRSILPIDIQVRKASIVSLEFDARYSALTRRYSYTICDAETGTDVFNNRFVLSHRKQLDERLMNKASSELIGLHDFYAFCKNRVGSTTIRNLIKFTWVRKSDFVICEIIADAFCYSMVRGLVGAMVQVGERKRDPGWPKQIMDKRKKINDLNVVSAHALILEEVTYPHPSLLKEQSLRTKRMRTLEE
jgi:tRNA pseudouridine38-40 synthase